MTETLAPLSDGSLTRTRSPLGAPINTGHGAIDPEFVNEDQAPHIQPALFLLKGCPLHRVSLLREFGLFFE